MPTWPGHTSKDPVVAQGPIGRGSSTWVYDNPGFKSQAIKHGRRVGFPPMAKQNSAPKNPSYDGAIILISI